jgi:hypothetical protein
MQLSRSHEIKRKKKSKDNKKKKHKKKKKQKCKKKAVQFFFIRFQLHPKLSNLVGKN